MGKERKRSSKPESLPPGLALQGVGARQEETSTHQEGGEYPDICTDHKSPMREGCSGVDPRIREIEQMGVSRIWLDVAKAIGVDEFLKMWEILDTRGATGPRERFYIPRFSTYLRFQRNRYIESLAADGVPVASIRRKVNIELCEQLSHRHVSRLAAKLKT